MNSSVKSARFAGVLYLLIIVFGLIAQIFVRDQLVDYDNATATAKNIIASEFRYRLGFVCELLMLVCDLGVTTFLFILFIETKKHLALLSTFLRLASIIILSVVALSHIASLSFLQGSNFLAVFSSDQLQALALWTVRLHGTGYNISLFFFGFHLIILGYIMYNTDLFPKFIGALLSIGGICYIVNSFTWFLFPELLNRIYPAILIPCALGEWIFCGWLLIKGAKNSR